MAPLHGHIRSFIFQGNDPTSTLNLGPELHTDANAASDPNSNEANATTGWSISLSNTLLSSVASPIRTGSYAIYAENNTTPENGGGVEKTFTGLDDGAAYMITCYWRHQGTGDDWALEVDGIEKGRVLNTDTTYKSVSVQFTASGTTATVKFRERNATYDGGVYFDNLSLRKIL